ncbi:hypothetical protein L1987_48030 [Smallanthus sonchifolius]|uniref:Uncharacterized protein n=1 Tax=Smallanthus sonchifolius TaxID=185202 RepID=A0ACB9FRQ6_9ASTR|nr:hypothetical protein L1987_48030 [Smallanthus sonchifolius]
MNTLSESGPLKKRSSRKSARFNIPDVTPGSSSDSVKSNRNEITLDVLDDCHSVNTTYVEGSELTLYAKVSEKKTPSRRIHHVLEELESQEVGGVGMKEHSIAAEALKGLKFIINKKDGPAALAAAEMRFDELTKYTKGLLHRSRFGECIEWITKKKDSTDSGSMKGDPEYFSERLFDSLCRRRNIAGEMINKKQFEEFWAQIVNPSFDSTLQTFFDLVDKDGDGKITRKEITEVIAVAIAIGVGLHAISHLACDFPRLIHATEEEYKPMQQFFGDQAKNYWHFVKEVEGYTGIIMVVVYSKNALALQMRKPQRFEYNSGQYMFVKYADISPFEWHPFSITSAPSDDFLSVHIRDLGDWTKEINSIFRDEEVVEMDTNGVIEMHNHCTSVYKEGDVRSAIIAMLQKLGYAKDGVDLVSNTRVKSHFGRPNWCDVYKQIDRNHAGSRIGQSF